MGMFDTKAKSGELISVDKDLYLGLLRIKDQYQWKITDYIELQKKVLSLLETISNLQQQLIEKGDTNV
jgi:hypothetical protein